jgi:hypothetical protein
MAAKRRLSKARLRQFKKPAFPSNFTPFNRIEAECPVCGLLVVGAMRHIQNGYVRFRE